MNDLLFALNAVLPIVLLIALGYVLKGLKLFTEEFLSVGNKLCFTVLLPTVLFDSVYDIESLSDVDASLVAYCVGSIIAAFLLGLIVVKLFVPERDQKGVVLQCTFRSNYAMIGLPLAELLYGAEGKAIASLMAAFIIPTLNILAVIALTAFIKGDENEDGGFLKNLVRTLSGIIKNPLIIGVVAGIVVLIIRGIFERSGITFRLSDIEVLSKTVSFVAAATTPFALMVLGGQFALKHFAVYKKQIVIATFFRMVVVPALFVTIAVLLFGFKGAKIVTVVAIFGSPIATASAIMAREMHSDADLAGALVVSTTVVSSVTLVVLVTILKACAVI